jgi:beta-glucanase (GH16 family)
MLKPIALGAALVALHLSAFSPHQIVIRNVNDPDNIQPAFNGSDEFSAALNTNNWIVLDREGDTSNSELQCFKPANTTIGSGFLNFLAKVESVTCNGNSYANTSGGVMWKTLNFTYGSIEVSGRVSGAGGAFPSIWLLGANCQDTFSASANDSGDCTWPQVGSQEIDIADFHFVNALNVDQRIYQGAANPGCSPGLTDASVNTHVYRFEWSAGSAIWKIDGTTTCTITSNVPSTPMFFILDFALHNTVSGLPSTVTWDYVRVTHP